MVSSKDKSNVDFVLYCYLCQMAKYPAWKLILGKNSGEVDYNVYLLMRVY